MSNADPEVSVVVPVYNGERYIREAIESVLREAEELAVELVVIDDGSTDSTPEILSEYSAHDPRVIVDRDRGPTIATALNRGCGIANASFLARLDADDADLPGRLRAQRDFLVDHPEVVLLGGQPVLVDEEGREFGTARYPLDDAALREAMRMTNPFVHSAVMMRRSAFEAAGGYRANLPHAEDLDLWLRLAERGKLANLPDAVVRYRIHGGQLSLEKQADQAVYAEATRVSARARRAGQPDPLEGAELVDEEFLVAHGVDRREITAAVIDSATWLARTSGRAGYAGAEAQLIASAYDRARSESGSRALVARVHRSVAHRHAEQGHPIRAKLKAAQARLAERA
ncbi:MAG TPA: glycosyltransferase [Solirubrobacterales bacterium]|jgi:GT2 family glycosyltransferase|nr:glycosyltransferase [Solirubrobacterales bacterium]